jgi:hypothetical protein
MYRYKTDKVYTCVKKQTFSIQPNLSIPAALFHINAAVLFERDAFGLKQGALMIPAGDGSSACVYYSVRTGVPWGFGHYFADKPGPAGYARQKRQLPV